jgi:hypothetical protein
MAVKTDVASGSAIPGGVENFRRSAAQGVSASFKGSGMELPVTRNEQANRPIETIGIKDDPRVK